MYEHFIKPFQEIPSYVVPPRALWGTKTRFSISQRRIFLLSKLTGGVAQKSKNIQASLGLHMAYGSC